MEPSFRVESYIHDFISRPARWNEKVEKQDVGHFDTKCLHLYNLTKSNTDHKRRESQVEEINSDFFLTS